jgi:SNF2 family DNA or RNA helicase
VRATREEQAHLLPDLTIRVLRLEQKVSGSQDFETKDDLEDILAASAEQKLAQVRDRVSSALASGATHVAVLTYHIPLANFLADALKDLGPPVVLVTGESTRTTKKRRTVLDGARRADKCILVASMKSIGIGIDLTKFTRTLVAELYYAPAVVIQALGRFSRLSGKLPSQIDVLVFKNSAEEVCASVLMEKLDNLSRTMKQTGVERMFENALDGDDDETFFKRMQSVAQGHRSLLDD